MDLLERRAREAIPVVKQEPLRALTALTDRRAMVTVDEVFPAPPPIVQTVIYDDYEGLAYKGTQTEEFWLNPPYGRPRNIDFNQLEQFEKSEWVQICTEAIVDAVANADWDIVPRSDDPKVEPPVNHIEVVKGFFEGLPSEDSFRDILGAMIPDLLWYDAGSVVKVFPVSAYDGEANLKEGVAPVDLNSMDGRSFLVETSPVGGKWKRFWQYSWLNPSGIPTSFDVREVIYFRQRANSRGVYGTSKLEVIKDVVNYLADTVLASSKYWENGLFIGGQIDHPDIQDPDMLRRKMMEYKTQLQGPRKANKWLVTGGGVKIQGFPYNPQQMQWLDGQKWYAKVVMAIFKIAPSELGFCHSEDTEFLTSNGFKLFDDITDEDLIGTYNRKTGLLEYQHPIKKYHYEYEGEMVHFKGRSVDVLVTPNHRMLVQPYTNEWRIAEAKDISWSQFYFKQACNWESCSEIDMVEIPIPSRKDHDMVYREVLCWNITDFLEFLGWFVSEGCVAEFGRQNGHYRVDISQNEGIGSDEIRMVLSRLNINFNEFKNENGNISFIFSNKQIYEFIKPMKNELPRWILDLSVNQLEIFLLSLCKGDGHFCDEKNDRREFYTTKKVIADQVQEIAIKCGYRTNLGTKSFEQENWKDLYTVYMSKYTDKAYLEQNNIIRENYSGYVNCFAVPNGYLITRRNGKVSIHHNTEDLNRATGIQQMNIHKSRAIRPVLNMIADTINRRLIWTDFFDDVKFVFPETLDLDDESKRVTIDEINVRIGKVTINELRRRDGMDEFDDEKFDSPFAEVANQQEQQGQGGSGFGGFGFFDEEGYGEEEEEEVGKAVNVGAGSGEPGYATIPLVVDGAEIDTKGIEDKHIKDIEDEWEKERKKLMIEVERLYKEM